MRKIGESIKVMISFTNNKLFMVIGIIVFTAMLSGCTGSTNVSPTGNHTPLSAYLADNECTVVLDTTGILFPSNEQVNVGILPRDSNEKTIDADVSLQVIDPDGNVLLINATKNNDRYDASFMPPSNGTYVLTGVVNKPGYKMLYETMYIVVDQMSRLKANYSVDGNVVIISVYANGALTNCTANITYNNTTESRFVSNGKLYLFNESPVTVVVDKMLFEPTQIDYPGPDTSAASSNPNVNVNKRTIVDYSRPMIYNAQWGNEISSNGQALLNGPMGIALGPNGHFYVVNNNVMVFDSNGKYLTQWDAYGANDMLHSMPDGIAINSTGYVYVVDRGNSLVNVFDPAGKYLYYWGGRGSNDGQFQDPVGIAINSTGYVYVTDTGNNRVQLFDAGGKYVYQWGGQGKLNGQLNDPHGIAIDSLDQVYVADTDNHRVQVFDPDGKYLKQWGEKAPDNGYIFSPRSIVISPSGYMFTDYRDGIQVLDVNFNVLSRWGSWGTAPDQFMNVYGMTLNSSDYLFVSNGNSRVSVYAPQTNTYVVSGP